MLSENLTEQLQRENDFSKYVDLLAKASKQYCIFIASNDTPCGSPLFTEKLAARLCRALGTRVLLHDKFRCSYIAVVNSGKLVHENISQDLHIEFNREINNVSIRIKSEQFRSDRLNRAFIEIDGIDYSHSGRGLNIVVFDKKRKLVLDNVAFDTYNQNEIRASQRTKVSGLEWNEFYKELVGVTFVSFSLPSFPPDNLSRNERFIVDNELNLQKILENADKPISAISEYIHTPEGLYDVLSPPRSYVDTSGVRRFFDKCGQYVNLENGHRVTPGQPMNPKRAIWFVGGCQTFGVGARDEGTIQTALQYLLNENAPEQSFIVHNYGCYLWGTDNNEEMLKQLKSLPLKPGDIIIGAPYIKPIAVAVGSVYGFRPHNFGELFWDRDHCTETANILVARVIFNTLSEHNFFGNYHKTNNAQAIIKKGAMKDDKPQNYGLSLKQLELLELYKSSLSTFYEQKFGNVEIPPKIGSIVMNCNPFTLGHRYLIEQAAAMVDFLVIFVVQEDKSFFPFDDRIDLVCKGTEDLPNVGVIESGSFIISAITFSEYFNKSEMQDMFVDSSTDVTLFAHEIAPAMHISVRFAGTEPFDRVTKQYNETLSVILPRYGIEFIEIPRHEVGNAPVSASRVRTLLEQYDWIAIKKLVPATTYEYLQERFM